MHAVSPLQLVFTLFIYYFPSSQMTPLLAPSWPKSSSGFDRVPTSCPLNRWWYSMESSTKQNKLIKLKFLDETVCLLSAESYQQWPGPKLERPAGVLWGEAVCSGVYRSGAFSQTEERQRSRHEDSGERSACTKIKLELHDLFHCSRNVHRNLTAEIARFK